MRIVIVVMLLAVLVVLGSAGVFMLRRNASQDGDRRMARTLALRVTLSIALFLIVLLAWWLGWIKPTGLPTSR